jgi:hypothetical protein
MAMLEMLSEVIRAKELLRMIALAEFMQINQMLDPGLPIALRRHLAFLSITQDPGPAARKLVAAVTARVRVVRRGGRDVECVYVARERGAGPGMAAEVEGVLVALGFVFVLEAVLAVCAFVLLL